MEVLLRIVCPRFVAGVVARDGKVVRAAPIVWRKLMGVDGKSFVAICKRNGWQWEKVG